MLEFKVITKVKPIYINRPVQKLYPSELHCEADVEKENITDMVEGVWHDNAQIRKANKLAAALLMQLGKLSLCLTNRVKEGGKYVKDVKELQFINEFIVCRM